MVDGGWWMVDGEWWMVVNRECLFLGWEVGALTFSLPLAIDILLS
jgi:hypothetical protein